MCGTHKGWKLTAGLRCRRTASEVSTLQCLKKGENKDSRKEKGGEKSLKGNKGGSSQEEPKLLA